MKNREILGVSGVIRVHSNSIVKFSELISVGEKKIGTSIADYFIEFMKPHSLIVKRNKLEISLKLLIHFLIVKKLHISNNKIKRCVVPPFPLII